MSLLLSKQWYCKWIKGICKSYIDSKDKIDSDKDKKKLEGIVKTIETVIKDGRISKFRMSLIVNPIKNLSCPKERTQEQRLKRDRFKRVLNRIIEKK